MTGLPDRFAVRGQLLSFRGDPFAMQPEEAVRFVSDGAMIVEDGMIADTGPADEVLARNPGIPVHEYRGDLIMAGFVDCHTHYPQCEVIASYGEQLMEWLQRYTFPAELKFADPDYARVAADHFLDECLRNGVTTASVYCTVHPQSVDAIFEAAQERGLRMAAGKMMMDRNAPGGLTDTAKSGYDESKALLLRWHGRDRLRYAISPRFAVTSTPEQLEAAGALWREHPGALMQTHIDENRDEIAAVRSLFPNAPDYFGVYERHGLTGPGANFGHFIHCEARERDALAESGSGVSHCPASNLFLGSGLFDMEGLRERPNAPPVGLATDIGAGTSQSMFTAMRASYEICRLRGYGLHPAKAYYLATVGSARVMRMEDRIGNLAAGREADFIVIDLQSTEAIAHRMRYAHDLWEMLFVQMMMAGPDAVRAVYVNGRRMRRREAD